MKKMFLLIIAVSFILAGCDIGGNDQELDISSFPRSIEDGPSISMTITGNPIDGEPGSGGRNGGDPSSLDTPWGVSYISTSCDEEGYTSDKPYPMNKTYLYATDWYNGKTRMKDYGVIIEEDDFNWCDKNDYLWAPDIYRDDSGKYWLYVGVMDDGKQRIAIATADYVNARYTPVNHQENGTQKGYVTGLKGKNNNEWAYDPGVFKAKDGKVYISYCDGNYVQNENQNGEGGRLRVAILNSDLRSVESSTDHAITFATENNPGDIYMEGPDLFVYNIDGENFYYLIFAAKPNSNHQEYIGYAMKTESQFNSSYYSDWNFKGWIFQNEDGDEWTNHATLSRSWTGAIDEWEYYIYYHMGFKTGTNKNRRVCRQQIEFNNQGIISRSNLLIRANILSGSEQGTIKGVSMNASLRHMNVTKTQTTDLKAVYVRVADLAENMTNQGQPSFIINNSTDQTLSNFKVIYYITSENGKIPVVDDISTPNSTPYIQHISGNQWALVLDFNGKTLPSGESMPGGGDSGNTFFGENVSLHYSDNSNFDKSNDFSQPYAGYFSESETITIVNGDGTVVAGTAPPMFKLKNVWANKLVTVRASESPDGVYSQSLNSSWDSQDWLFIPVGEGKYIIKSTSTDTCLTVSNDYYGDARKVYAQARNENWPTQEWEITYADYGSKRFYNAYTNTYLTANSTSESAFILAQSLNTGWGSQKWWMD